MNEVYKRTDLAWAAGIIDGEGCVGITARYRPGHSRASGYSASLVVINTSMPMLSKLRELFGGCINARKLKCSSWAQCWRWHVRNQFAADVLRLIRPYLVVKGRQAELCLELEEHKGMIGNVRKRGLSRVELNYRESLRRECNLLNGRGAAGHKRRERIKRLRLLALYTRDL